MAGYINGKTSPDKADDLLVSSVAYEKSGALILAGQEDAGNLANPKVLRKGLVLVPLTSGADEGKYVVFAAGGLDGAGDEEGAVVLTQDHDMSNGTDELVHSDDSIRRPPIGLTEFNEIGFRLFYSRNLDSMLGCNAYQEFTPLSPNIQVLKLHCTLYRYELLISCKKTAINLIIGIKTAVVIHWLDRYQRHHQCSK